LDPDWTLILGHRRCAAMLKFQPTSLAASPLVRLSFRHCFSSQPISFVLQQDGGRGAASGPLSRFLVLEYIGLLMRVLACDELRQIGHDAVRRADTSEALLIQRAGYAVAQFCLAHFKFRTVCVICGNGGNGTDGLMAAQVLSGIAEQVSVIVLATDEKALSADAAAICRNFPVSPLWVGDEAGFEDDAVQSALEADLIVDAVAGTGFKPPFEGTAKKAVEVINRASGIVVSVDLPSGVEPERTARVHQGGNESVFAHGVITFVGPKPAHVFGELTSGPIAVSELGVQPSLASSQTGLSVITGQDVWITFPPRPEEANKGDFGHVLVIGGALDRAGSAGLSGIAALRTGAGLVTVACPRSSQPTIAGFAQELMTHGLPEAEGTISAAAHEKIGQLMTAADVVVLGPGFSRNDPTAELVGWAADHCPSPLVFHPDALSAIIRKKPELSRGNSKLRVLILEPEQAAELLAINLDELQKDRVGAARRIADQRQSCVVLKGFRMIVAGASGETWINMTGNSALAKSGSDDVLSGIMAAAISRHPENRPGFLKELDVASAVYLHGLTGDLARDIFHENTVLATDLLETLSDAFRDCEQQIDRDLFYLHK
jgi:ADP-dependent NAD(P)H-hydrate dehydratase / NAD(P)H-hydrate epimerase